LRKIGAFQTQGFDVDDTTRTHQYKGQSAETAKTNEAVRLTSNQILTYRGQPIEALYSTVAGGKTASAAEAFRGGAPIPYLITIDDVDANGRPYAAASRFFSWQVDLSAETMASTLQAAGINLGRIRVVEVAARTTSGRVAGLRVIGEFAEVTIPGTDLRRVFGANFLRSTLFDIVKTSDGWQINGKGWGHGVGMCQAGAMGRAAAGQSFQQILSAYYPGSDLLVFRGSLIQLSARGSWVDRRKYSREGAN
jgi:stage II sporulation protein D